MNTCFQGNFVCIVQGNEPFNNKNLLLIVPILGLPVDEYQEDQKMKENKSDEKLVFLNFPYIIKHYDHIFNSLILNVNGSQSLLRVKIWSTCKKTERGDSHFLPCIDRTNTIYCH